MAESYIEYLGPCAPYFTTFGAIAFGCLAVKVVWEISQFSFRLLRRACVSVDFRKYGSWAVITGCTDGIGKSYAMQLAEKGLDVVLISRNPQKLSRTAEEIESRYKVRVKTITADFKRTDIYDVIRDQLQGLDIGVLVNNVAMGHEMTPQYYFKMHNYLQYSMDSVYVNVMSCVMMTCLVLPAMLERQRGVVINVGSFGGELTPPFFGVYSATKAFVKVFSENLQAEYGSQGITVQLVKPSFVDTNMPRKSTKVFGLKPGLLFPTPDRYVASALRTVGKETATAGYWPHELEQFVFLNIIPKWLMRRMFLSSVSKWKYVDKKGQ